MWRETREEEEEKYLEPSIATVGMEYYGTNQAVTLNEKCKL